MRRGAVTHGEASASQDVRAAVDKGIGAENDEELRLGRDVEDALAVYGRRGRRRPKVVLTRGRWKPARSLQDRCTIVLEGRLQLRNLQRAQEIFVPRVEANAFVLSEASIAGVAVETRVQPRHDLSDGYRPPDEAPRPRADGYWPVFILQGRSRTFLDVTIEVRAADPDALSALTSCCLDVAYDCYGPDGHETRHQHVILPVGSAPDAPGPSHGEGSDAPPSRDPPAWTATSCDAAALPIATHVLHHGDDPLAVVSRYAIPHARPGDVLAIAETPLAIMQVRGLIATRRSATHAHGWRRC